jgi:pimeloyl-ACP methyl ester carboxylesterase/DNA-binding CsgD family transcriptional regulator
VFAGEDSAMGGVEPIARLCRLDEGPQVAYASCGEGPPLVMLPGWLSHLVENWAHPAAASARRKLAGSHRFVWYDRLGCGLSDREGFEPTLENDVAQLEAVLNAAGVERACLIGYSFGAPPAAVFAARHPERVERLVFVNAFARGSALGSDETFEAFRRLIAMDWAIGSRALATIVLPNGSSEDLRWFDHFQRRATTAEMAVRLLEHEQQVDVRDVLPEVRAPTLVLHDRLGSAVPFAAGEELAALVPGAHLVVLDGNEHDPFIRDSGGMIEAILDFLAGGIPAPPLPPAAPSSVRLTPRERQVLRLIAQGAANKQIAARLDISLATVERHVTNLYRKLDARGRADATLAAVALGLVVPDPIR